MRAFYYDSSQPLPATTFTWQHKAGVKEHDAYPSGGEPIASDGYDGTYSLTFTEVRDELQNALYLENMESALDLRYAPIGVMGYTVTDQVSDDVDSSPVQSR